MKIKIRPKSIVEILFVLILIISCRSMYMSILGMASIVSNLSFYSLILLTIIYFCLNDLKIKKREINFVIIAQIYGLIYFLINGYSAGKFYLFLEACCCLFIWVNILKRNGRLLKVFYTYEKFILIIAGISMFFWIFASILGVLKPIGIIFSNWTGESVPRQIDNYYYLYFSVQKYFSITRNTAIFVEAPVYGFHLILALLVEIFCCKKVSIKRVALLSITILTTICTTAYIVAVLIFVYRYIFQYRKRNIWAYIRLLIVPMVIIVGIFLIQTLILNKLSTDSGSIRLDDFKVGYNAWKQHPLWGGGYGNVEYLQSFMGHWRAYNMGFSNSIMQILSYGGLFLFIPYLIFSIRTVVNSMHCKNYNVLFMWFSFVFYFTFLIVPFQYLTIFVFMALPELALDKSFFKRKYSNKKNKQGAKR